MPKNARLEILSTQPRIRTDLSQYELVRLQGLALREGVPAAEMIGRVLRDFIQEHDPQPRRKRLR